MLHCSSMIGDTKIVQWVSDTTFLKETHFCRKLGDGLFLRCCDEVSRDYPDIEYNSMIIDNCCMQVNNNDMIVW
jgi:hypothetical protein